MVMINFALPRVRGKGGGRCTPLRVRAFIRYTVLRAGIVVRCIVAYMLVYGLELVDDRWRIDCAQRLFVEHFIDTGPIRHALRQAHSVHQVGKSDGTQPNAGERITHSYICDEIFSKCLIVRP